MINVVILIHEWNCFETVVSTNSNLCRKLVLSLEFSINFDERFKVTSVPFFLLEILTNDVVNYTILHLTCYIQ